VSPVNRLIGSERSSYRHDCAPEPAAIHHRLFTQDTYHGVHLDLALMKLSEETWGVPTYTNHVLPLFDLTIVFLLHCSLPMTSMSRPSGRAINEFSRAESFAPIFRSPVWQQYRDLEASSVEARTKLAYERARSLVEALGKKNYNPHEVRSTLIPTFRSDN
jgi:hypothetical protein